MAEVLKQQALTVDCVLGIPRGGVVVAYQIAKELKLPLDVLLVKKVGAPQNPELAIGAIVENNFTSIPGADTNRVNGVTPERLEQLKSEKEQELKAQKRAYHHKSPEVKGKTVLVVDDGAATGITIETAVMWLRRRGVKEIRVALPVASLQFVSIIKPRVEGLTILETPAFFGAVGQFYQDFNEVSDREVIQILKSTKS